MLALSRLLFALLLFATPAYALGLGQFLGLTKPIAVTSSGPDWSGYDGTNDAAQQLIFTDGDNYGPTALAPASATEFVLATRDRNNTQTRRVAVASITGNTVAIENQYNITGVSSTGIFPSMTRTAMGSDRYLTLFTGSGGDFISLHSKSGTVLTEEDVESGISLFTANRNFRSLEKLDDTTAAMWYSPASGTNYRIAAVDITGDAITFGTAADSGGSTSSSRYGAMTVIDSGHVLTAYDSQTYLWSRSGLTFTLEDNINSVTAGTALNDMAGSAIARDGCWAFAYEDGATTKLQVIEYNTTTDTLTRGDNITLKSTSSFNGPQEASLVKASEGVILAAITESSANDTNIFKIDIAEDCTPTSSEIKNVEGDHAYIRMMEGNAQAVVMTQVWDGLTDEVGVYVLNP